MITITRKDFTVNPFHNILYDLVVKEHKVPQYIHDHLSTNTLPDNEGIGNRTFVELFSVEGSLYIHYDTFNSLKNGMIQTTITEICVYDDFNEYEPVRLKSLHSTTKSEGICLN
jgi:hypothetical protein